MKKKHITNKICKQNKHIKILPYEKPDGSTTGIGRPWYSNIPFKKCCSDMPSYSNTPSLSNSYMQIYPFSQHKILSAEDKDKDTTSKDITIDYIDQEKTADFFTQYFTSSVEDSAYFEDTSNSNPENQWLTISINTNTSAYSHIYNNYTSKNCSNSPNAKVPCIDNSAIIESTLDNSPNGYATMNHDNFDISKTLSSWHTTIDSNNLKTTQVSSSANDKYAPCTDILCIEHTKEDTRENFSNIKKLVKNTVLPCGAILFLGMLFHEIYYKNIVGIVLLYLEIFLRMLVSYN
ncbi:hypothetical protein NEPAR04_0191 [Nematocida parisii]|nr:hypothetical protein NEPAR03_0185 [Nematocida parisii]KAI5125721.1 hypothetical protein NEPAR08_0159 [Nematocida parisii]KAI5140246.1 hypothetical protein NEPAR04_0191 [Nematocida parisii]